jgi:O-acetylserine/cysteine efflux transporter
MPLRDVLIALVVVTIWGVNFTVIKLSVAEMPPLLVAALRFFFAAVPVIFFVARPKAPWRLVIGYGLFMGTALYALLNLALFMGLSASLASLALQMQAMFTIGLAFVVFGEVPRRLQIAGAVVAFAGIGVIAWGHGTGTELLPMVPFTVWGNFFASIPLFVLSFMFEGGAEILAPVAPPSWNVVGLIAFLAYPATLFGFAMWSALLSRHSAATVAPFTLLVPIAGISSGVLILGEPIYPVDIAGGLLVFVGLLLTVFKLKPKQAPIQPVA